MKKNEICEIKITGMTSEGNGVGRADDGMAVFVPLTAVGDVISCKIVKVTKSCAFGIIERIIVLRGGAAHKAGYRPRRL